MYNLRRGLDAAALPIQGMDMVFRRLFWADKSLEAPLGTASGAALAGAT